MIWKLIAFHLILLTVVGTSDWVVRAFWVVICDNVSIDTFMITIRTDETPAITFITHMSFSIFSEHRHFTLVWTFHYHMFTLAKLLA